VREIAAALTGPIGIDIIQPVMAPMISAIIKKVWCL
jgi:hypothetical protein